MKIRDKVIHMLGMDKAKPIPSSYPTRSSLGERLSLLFSRTPKLDTSVGVWTKIKNFVHGFNSNRAKAAKASDEVLKKMKATDPGLPLPEHILENKIDMARLRKPGPNSSST